MNKSTTDGWKGAKVFITGVCGTVGGELLRQLAAMDVEEIVGVDNNESELFFKAEEYNGDPRVRLYLGDVRDKNELSRKMSGVGIVLHAAALKHVILCERSPHDAMLTNIIGVQNIIDAALANGVSRVLFTSSDKAVNPTNVMGATKLVGEKLMTAANSIMRNNGPIFVSTRFGNVLGSRGSVMPLFTRQIAAGGPVTLTDESMTRFIMTLNEAVKLMLSSVFLAKGGEVFITKMPVARIAELADVMIEKLAPVLGRDPESIAIKKIGAKPGEKYYEELMNEEEVRRAIETEDFFIILPAIRANSGAVETYQSQISRKIERPYNSSYERPLSRKELAEYLERNGLFDTQGI